MNSVVDLLRQLRAQRRDTVLALRSVREEQLTTPVGPRRAGDVRATLLSIAQDDDRRCAALGGILAGLEWRPTEAQRILASLAHTRSQLRAAVVPLTDALLDQVPAPGEWSVRQALQHLMNNERRFVSDTAYAIERRRSPEPLPIQRTGEIRGAGTLGPEVPGTVEDVVEALEQVRDHVVTAAMPLGEAELAAATPGPGQEVEVRYMLHRRATHERQHTVQILKTLRAIGCQPSEAEMLLEQAEIARGVLEGIVVGAADSLIGRVPPGDGASIEQVLEDARAEENSKLTAILSAIA